jgi:hypothetical protein
MDGVCCVGSTCQSSTSDECGAIGGDRQNAYMEGLMGKSRDGSVTWS